MFSGKYNKYKTFKVRTLREVRNKCCSFSGGVISLLKCGIIKFMEVRILERKIQGE